MLACRHRQAVDAGRIQAEKCQTFLGFKRAVAELDEVGCECCGHMLGVGQCASWTLVVVFAAGLRRCLPSRAEYSLLSVNRVLQELSSILAEFADLPDASTLQKLVGEKRKGMKDWGPAFVARVRGQLDDHLQNADAHAAQVKATQHSCFHHRHPPIVKRMQSYSLCPRFTLCVVGGGSRAAAGKRIVAGRRGVR